MWSSSSQIFNNSDPQDFFNKIIEASPNIVYVFDLLQRKNVFSNIRIEEVLGYSYQSLLEMGENITTELIHPEDLEKIAKYWAQISLSEQDSVHQIEFRVKHKHGHWVWLQSRDIIFSRTPDGAVEQILGTAEDISEEKFREHELRQSREFFQSTFDQSLIGMALVEMDGKWSKVNKAMCQMLGYNEEELRNMTYDELTHSDDVEIDLESSFKLFTKQQKTCDYEKRYIHKDGSIIWVIMSGFLSRELDGSPQYFVIQAQNITKRKQDEEALREQKELFEQAFFHAPIGKALVSPEGKLLQVNRTFCETIGYTEPELLQKTFKDITHYQDREADAQQYQNLLDGKISNYELEKRYVHKDGHLVWGLLSIGLVRNSEGQPQHVVAQVQNITERKEFEIKMKQAKEEAEAGNKAKSEFLATISHELRTPLNGVIGMAQLLESTALDSEQQDYVKVLNTSAETLLFLINEVLDFSKIESNRLFLEKSPFNLADCIEDILKMTLPKAKEKGLEIIYYQDPRLPEILYGDVHRLKQVLLNLVTNSVKFTHIGEITLETELVSSFDEEGLEVRFSVQDTGIGIPVDKLESLFQPFSQLDSSTTRKYGGTGLGLAICRKLVHLMGGKLEVRSIVHEGSTFSFTVLLGGKVRELPKTGEHFKYRMLNHKKILIVSSNETLNRNIKHLCKGYGMSVKQINFLQQLNLDGGLRDYDFLIIDNDCVNDLGPLNETVQDLLTICLHHSHEKPKFKASASLVKPIKPAELGETLIGFYRMPPFSNSPAVPH